MSNKKVYMDFQDGNGFVDVSNFVLYENFTITRYGFNDAYSSAQSECNFSMRYNSTLFPLLTSNDIDIILMVKEGDDDYFYGHIPYNRNWKYNGVPDNTITNIDAVDDTDYLDVEVGDIIYANCAVCDPSNPSASIIHLLATIAGFGDRVDSSVTIDTVIPRFAPMQEKNTVFDLISLLAYEYGYVFSFNASGNISFIKWNLLAEYSLPTIPGAIGGGSIVIDPSQIPTYVTPVHSFDENNIIQEINIQDKTVSYDSVEVTHYELETLNKVRVYTDSNCPYGDDGTFEGYPIPPTYLYPPKANVIDESTGVNQLVYQEYTDEAIEYFTNKAIKEQLDYKYKNFSSDFSGIVATENHVIENKFDIGISLDVSEFGNKKARLLYKNNNTTEYKSIYYNNIYADVWYKTSEREIVVCPDGSKQVKPNAITLNYVYDGDTARWFARAMSKQIEIGSSKYVFLSDDYVPEGSPVYISFGEVTNVIAIVQSVMYEEYTEQYKYTCVLSSLNRRPINYQISKESVSVKEMAPYVLTPSNTEVHVPYVMTVGYDYSEVFIDLSITRGGLDYSQNWSISEVSSTVTGTWVGNRYHVTDVPSGRGVVTFTASRLGWDDLTVDVVVSRDAIKEAIDDAISGGGGDTPPSDVGTVTSRANQTGIDISWVWQATQFNNIVDHFEVGITKDNGNTWDTYTTVDNTFTYEFDRDVDGYPEVADFSDWGIRVKAINVYGLASLNYSESLIDTSTYKGWTPSVPTLGTRVSGRGVSLGWNFTHTWYGQGDVDIQIAKGYTLDVDNEIVLITDTGTLEAYPPAVGVDPTASYENYKEGALNEFLTRAGNAFFISLPLYGQNEAPIVSRDTPYYIRVRSVSDQPTTASPDGREVSSWSDWELVYAHASSAQDVVRAWELNDLGEKVRVDGSLGAEQIYANFLSAISANLGVITDGALEGNENNMWALSRIYEDDGITVKHYEGTVRMGGEDQYLHVTPIVTAGVVVGYNIDFRVGNFTVTAVGSVVNGKFEVRNLRGDTVYFSIDPENKGLAEFRGQVKIGSYTNPQNLLNIQDKWGVSSVSFTGTGVNDLEIIENGEVAGNFEVEIVRDGDGETWTLQQDISSSIHSVYSIAIGNGFCLATTTNGEMWKSIDSGATWTLQQVVGSINSEVVIHENYSLCTGSNGGIWKSIDEGATWTLQQNINLVVKLAIGNSFCLATTANGRIWKSIDEGATWTLQQYLEGYSAIVSLSIGDTFCLCGNTQGEVWKSIDEGATWTLQQDIGDKVSSIIIQEDYCLAGADFNIYRSVDDGASWYFVSSNYIDSSIGVFNGICLTCGVVEPYIYGVYISTDGGVTWELQQSFSDTPMTLAFGNGIGLIGFKYGPIYRMEMSTAKWQETSVGTWSDEFLIGKNYSTELTGYGITIGFAQEADHVVGDSWTFTQGVISGLSIRDENGVEYFNASNGCVKHPLIPIETGSTTIPNCGVGTIVKYVKTSAYDGTAVTITPPSGVLIWGRLPLELYGQYSYVILERISNTVFVVTELNDDYKYSDEIQVRESKTSTEYWISDTITIAPGLNVVNYTVPKIFNPNKSYISSQITDPTSHWLCGILGTHLKAVVPYNQISVVIQNNDVSQDITLKVTCNVLASYLIMNTLVTENGDTIVTDTGMSIAVITSSET